MGEYIFTVSVYSQAVFARSQFFTLTVLAAKTAPEIDNEGNYVTAPVQKLT